MNRLAPSLLAVAIVSAASIAQATPPDVTTADSASFTGRQYARQAHVSLAAARAIALKARPGQITDQELEKERGGSGLRYSFDVKSSGRTYEVGVDAKSGKVLENGTESAAAEAAEASSEAPGK